MRVLLLVDFANLYYCCLDGVNSDDEARNRLMTVLESLRSYIESRNTAHLQDAKIVHAEVAVLDDDRWRHRWRPLEQRFQAGGFSLARIKRRPLISGARYQQVSADDDDHLIHIARTRWSEFDAVILVSNDGDYAETIHRLRSEGGIPAIVGSYETPNTSLATTLRHAASEILPLRDIADENDQPSPLLPHHQPFALHGAVIELWRDGAILLNFPLDRDRIEIGRRSVRMGHFPDIDLTDYDFRREVSRRAIYLHRSAGNWKLGIYPECRSITTLDGAMLNPGTVVPLNIVSQVVVANELGLIINTGT